MIIVEAKEDSLELKQVKTRYGRSKKLLVIELIISFNERDSMILTSLRIHSDLGFTPGIHNANNFNIVEFEIPRDWSTLVDRNEIRVLPSQFSDPEFWEQFFNESPKIVNIYEKVISVLKT